MFDLISEILQTLRHNKLRTALTGFAVAWGIFMLIVLLGVGNGVTGSFREHAMTPGSQKINVWPGRSSKPYHGYREGRYIPLKSADLDRVADETARPCARSHPQSMVPPTQFPMALNRLLQATRAYTLHN